MGGASVNSEDMINSYILLFSADKKKKKKVLTVLV